LPSPAGVAHTPAAAPVGSGHVGFAASAFVAVKYAGSDGASSARATPAVQGTAPEIRSNASTPTSRFRTFTMSNFPWV
jgi:hypothetical protein